MSEETATVDIDPVALSQDVEVRLRQLEAAALLLLGHQAMLLNKVKVDKIELGEDLAGVAEGIGYTINNYPIG